MKTHANSGRERLCLLAALAVVTAACVSAPLPSVSSIPTEPPVPTEAPVPGWRLVQRLEPPHDPRTGSVTVGARGFVAVVSTNELLQEGCWGEFQSGRVLMSTDGEQWDTSMGDFFAYARLDHIVQSTGNVYALGHVIPIEVLLEDTPGACGPRPVNVGVNVWRSADGGQSWERLPQSAEMQGAIYRDVVSVDDVLIAAGDGVWTSSDGIEWRNADSLPESVGSLAVGGDVVVAAGTSLVQSLAYSDDRGRNWHQATGDFDPGVLSWSVAARDGRFVAAGVAERGEGQATSLLTSDDGRHWTESPDPELGAGVMVRVVSLPDRFIGLAAETESVAEGLRFVGIGTWVSADGLDWRPAEKFPARDPFIFDLVAGPAGVVVIGGEGVWFAPVNTFE